MSEYVFAYGSNMCSARLRAYGISPEDAGTAALLAGYRLVFNKKSVDASGKANIEHMEGSNVWGVLYEIPEDALAALDKGEGGYHRVRLTVCLARGGSAEAWVYLTTKPNSDPALRPYSWYIHLIVEGAREHALPADYIELLERVESVADADLQRDKEKRALFSRPKPKSDIDIYCECIARVRHHISIADTVFAGVIDTGHRELNEELVFLHLRKALEELAFASLSANRDKYSAARAGFATEWIARRMLGFIEKVNPNFYPIPLLEPREIAPGKKHFDRVEQGFLTKEHFVQLYDNSAELIHCRNPYAPSNATTVTHGPDEWSKRFKALLSWHLVQLVNVPGIWVVRVPNQGPVTAFMAQADGAFVVETIPPVRNYPCAMAGLLRKHSPTPISR
jgi:gamma-glutamylcyclotransferase (GGCT)/AIG2-like uncharacterized protein YtfP